MKAVVNKATSKADHTEPLEEKISRWSASRSHSSSGCGWYKFVRSFGKIMTRAQAAFLQDLMNKAEMCRSQTVEEEETAMVEGRKPRKGKLLMGNNGFFRCSVRYMLNPRYDSWTPDEQNEHFKFLRRCGLVETKNRRTRMGTTRWVRINYELLEKEMDRAERVRIKQMVEFGRDPNWKKPKIQG